MTADPNTARAAALKRIPSLDGLRALSIVMVIGLHTAQRVSLTHPVSMLWSVVFNGGLGVFIFFVISGYLITRLLLHEHQTRGRISIRGFYLKRVFRILPPLWAYVAALGLLHLLGRLPLNRLSLVGALLFVQNYTLGPTTWAIEHFWSLSVEEQFYFLWPPVLITCLAIGATVGKPSLGRHRAALVTLAVIVLSPAVRILSFRSHQPLLHAGSGFHMHADALMFGCGAALLEGRRRFERLYRAITRWPLLPVLGLAIGSYLEIRYQNYWNFPIGETLAGSLIAMLLLWCVRNPHGVVGRALNARWITHLGVISYSMYLWQTLFLHAGNVSVFAGAEWLGKPPVNWLLIVLFGELSHRFIEQPSLTARNRLLRRIQLYRLPAAAPRPAVAAAQLQEESR